MALLAGYLAARTAAGAYTPATAPPYYHFTFEWPLVMRNVLEYADRSLTLSALTALGAWACLRGGTSPWPRFIRPRIIAAGAVWIAGGYALTLWLPVRSSLYACLPSVGGCVIAAEIAQACWQSAAGRSRARALIATLGVALVAAPIHASRTRRFVDAAEVSETVWRQLPALVAGVPDGGTVILEDDVGHRANLRTAFGSALDVACKLRTGKTLMFRITRDRLGARCPACEGPRFALVSGHLIPE